MNRAPHTLPPSRESKVIVLLTEARANVVLALSQPLSPQRSLRLRAAKTAVARALAKLDECLAFGG